VEVIHSSKGRLDEARSGTPIDVDVAIIGAGPAGATLATLLAARGRSVALIDRDTFPRDKVCGEFLSYDVLPLVDELGVRHTLEEHGAPEISRCRVVGRRHTYAFDFPRAARGVSRMLLDDVLFQAAVAHGAIPFEGRSASGLSNGNVTLDDGTVVRARVLAGAWGRWGRFDQQLARAFVRDRAHRNFGFKRHYRANGSQPAKGDDDVIELYAFRRGYLGVSSVEGGLTNVCGLVHASRLAQHKGRWDAFVAHIRGEEPKLDSMYGRLLPAQDHYLSSEPVIFRARSAVEAGIFMVGDASGVIDPLTGNGMAMAIQSAFLAAPYIERALDDRTRAENEYREQHRATFAPRIAWSRRVAFLLSRPALLDVALSGLRTRAIGEFLLRKTRGSG
jgi:flavin-dependent dehydrogenase